MRVAVVVDTTAQTPSLFRVSLRVAVVVRTVRPRRIRVTSARLCERRWCAGAGSGWAPAAFSRVRQSKAVMQSRRLRRALQTLRDPQPPAWAAVLLVVAVVPDPS